MAGPCRGQYRVYLPRQTPSIPFAVLERQVLEDSENPGVVDRPDLALARGFRKSDRGVRDADASIWSLLFLRELR